MSDDVATILGELQQDHRNMSLLLDLLESECNRLYHDETPDFELLHDIMQYMTVYPDAVHHPKEDRLYAELKAARPDLTAGFQRIAIDHISIAESGRRLRDDFASAESGTAVYRKSLVADALRYVNSLRSHMQWEELDLFRRCRQMAAQGHRLIVDADVASVRDPLFGKDVHSSYDRLFQRIKGAKGEKSSA